MKAGGAVRFIKTTSDPAQGGPRPHAARATLTLW
jgi:hypothetical protein